MAKAINVAAYILNKMGPLEAKKLQKLTYYSQVWSLVWHGEPLFEERIEAWRDGPVIPELYRLHRTKFLVRQIDGADSARLTNSEQDTVDSVLGYYGDRSAEALCKLSHSEQPWLSARRGLLPFQAGNREISQDSIREFYSSLK